MRISAIRRLGGIVAAAAIAAALPAHAVATTGVTTLVLDGPAAKSLRKSGIQIAAVKPAKGGPQRIQLPLDGGLLGASTTLLHHNGAISLQADDDAKLRLAKLDLFLGKRPRLTAVLNGEEIDLFRVLRGGVRRADATTGAIELSALRLKLTRVAARKIAQRLDLGRLRPLRFATLSASASGLISAGGPAATKPQDGANAQKSSDCPLPSGAGPAPENPLPIASRPSAAVDVTAATIDWHVRESFIRYIDTGEGTSVSGGASADPPVQLPGTSAPLSYTFHFLFNTGWLDAGANPTDPADDTAAIGFGGAVRFLYSGHGIDLTAADPEIEIAGANSRAIFAVGESGGAPERQVLVNLDLSRAGSIAASANQFTYERVPAAIPAGTASSVFAGFYAPGTEFGCVTVSFATGS